MIDSAINDEYLTKRAIAQGRSHQEIQQIITELGLFIEGTSEDSLISLDWVSEDDYAIIQDNENVKNAVDFLKQKRHTKEEDFARELSRCTEWHSLLGILINYIPENEAAQYQISA